MGMHTRELVLEVLLEAEKNETLQGQLVKAVLDKYDYETAVEKAFFKRLAEGTVERQITLDYVLDTFSRTPVQKMKPLIRCLLRMSAYQILYMDGVPDAAACNEAVKLAKKRGFNSLSGFVNGVLRSLSRKKDQLAWPTQQELVRRLSVLYSMPVWLVEKWLADYGEERTESILQAAQEERPVTLRMKEGMAPGELLGVLEAIERTGVKVSPQPLLGYAYEISGGRSVASLPGFEEGLFFVQDVSSMLAVEVAGIRPGMRVLDMCAAPGGKALSAAQKLQGRGELLAWDISEQKVERIRENAGRMKCRLLSCSVQDAKETRTEMFGWADVVMVDVPCSGLGVIGRKKEIRYRITPAKIEALVELQREILNQAWRYVRPGGILLYSTCTMNRIENEETVEWLTERFPLQTESLDPYLPKTLWNKETKAGRRQLFLGEVDTDGFFMARLRRKEHD